MGETYQQLERRLERGARRRLREIRKGEAERQASFGPSDSVSNDGHWLINAIGGGKTKAGVAVSHYNAVTMPAVWGCITIIADTVAQCPVDVYQRVGRRKEERRDHPAAVLFSGQANPRMNSETLVTTQQAHTLGWGNGYSEIQINGKSEPVALWPLLPDRTRPDSQWRDDRGEFRYEITVDGQRVSVPSRRVIHIKGYSWDGVVGLSPIMASRNAIGLGISMEEFGSKFFANDSRSGGIVMHPGKLSDKARKNIQDSVVQEGEGLEQAHRVKIFEEGMKFVPTTISPEDSQFLGSREFQIAEVARMFRVPLILLQSHQKDTAWGTGIEQLMIGFVQWTIARWAKCWEQELNVKLLTAEERISGYFVKLNLNALLRGDMAARADFYEKALDPAKGWMQRNEVREKEDLNPDGVQPVAEPPQEGVQ